MEPVPLSIQQTMVSSIVIAGAIRLFVGIAKTPAMGGVWRRLPKRTRPLALLALGTLAFFADAFAVGQPWYLALGAALTGLGSAVVSHDWQKLLSDAGLSDAEAEPPQPPADPS